jgi:hypothetical protein
MLRRVTLVRTDVSEEFIASVIKVKRISALETTSLAVTSNPRTLRRNLFLLHRFLSLWWWRRYVPPKRQFLQEPHSVTSQKTVFFTVTAVKTSNLTWICFRFQGERGRYLLLGTFLKGNLNYCQVSCLAEFDPEDGSDMFCRTFRSYTDYTALRVYPRRWQMSYLALWKLQALHNNAEVDINTK